MRGTVCLILCMAVILGLTSCELEQIVVENDDKAVRFASTSEKMLTSTDRSTGNSVRGISE